MLDPQPPVLQSFQSCSLQFAASMAAFSRIFDPLGRPGAPKSAALPGCQTNMTGLLDELLEFELHRIFDPKGEAEAESRLLGGSSVDPRWILGGYLVANRSPGTTFLLFFE